MLPSVCSVIDHRWRPNVVRTKKVVHEAIAKCFTDVTVEHDVEHAISQPYVAINALNNVQKDNNSVGFY